MSEKETAADALVLYVHLDGISPPIWRRLLVPPNLSLAGLHEVIQAAMGWEDAHLHDFRQGKGKGRRMLARSEMQDPGFPHDDMDLPSEDEVTVAEVLGRVGASMTYVYDYGDHWEHIVRLEDRVKDAGPLPRCAEGERAGPPEDCGGVPGYESCLAALKDPKKDPDRAEWIGGWDPEELDFNEVNEEIGERLAEPDLTGGPITAEILDFLADPASFGIPEQSAERYHQASADLFDLLLDSSEVAGYLQAADAGMPQGVLSAAEDEDGIWSIALFETSEDYLHDMPGEAHEPKRLLLVTFFPTIAFPPSLRRAISPEGDGVLPIPAVLLAESENVKPPNHEELDLMSAGLTLLTKSIEQWGDEDALPPEISEDFEVGGREVSVTFSPSADLAVREGDEEGESRGLSLGYEAEEDDEEETSD